MQHKCGEWRQAVSCAVIHLLPGRSSSRHLRCFHTLHEAIIQAIRIHSVSSPHPQLVLVSFFVALHLSNELLLVVLDALALHVVLHDGELHKA
jgi:hypothetical protein